MRVVFVFLCVHVENGRYWEGWCVCGGMPKNHSFLWSLLTGAFIFTLVVFRHNISHARYNEARALLSNIKNGLRGIMVLVAGCGIEVASGPRAVAYKAEVRELAKHLQVRHWSSLAEGSVLSF